MSAIPGLDITAISIIIGFIGVALILKPNASSLDLISLAGLAAGFFNGCSQPVFHRASKKDSSLTTNLYLCLFTTVFCLPMLFWHENIMTVYHQLRFDLSADLWLLLLFSVIAGIINQTARGAAYHHVKKAFMISPFLYFSIIFSCIIDWILFANSPSNLALMGAICIILGGILIIMDKARLFNMNHNQIKSLLKTYSKPH